jgi:hypothetical protein
MPATSGFCSEDNSNCSHMQVSKPHARPQVVVSLDGWAGSNITSQLTTRSSNLNACTKKILERARFPAQLPAIDKRYGIDAIFVISEIGCDLLGCGVTNM